MEDAMTTLRSMFLSALVGCCVPALAAPPALTPQPFVSGLSAPVEIAHANDASGRLFVLEQAGKVRIIKNGLLLAAPFLDLSAANGGPVRAGGEQGLLGLAFHPSYITNGRFFVYYTRALPGDAQGNEIVIERYARSATTPDLADPASASFVLAIAHPLQSNHNGGKLAFGPDGYLYAGIGDGGGAGDPFNAAQSLLDLRGKILRIDVDGPSSYAIPRSNPFVGDASARGEIWDFGLRNPWRFSFDRLAGDLLIGDVGQSTMEEIDFEPRGSSGGRNYGWSVFEGTSCFKAPCSLPGHVPPIIEYAHDSVGGFSVTGGYRYRGSGLPALAGHYVYGDFVSDRIWGAAPDGTSAWTTTQVGTLANLSTFGEDEFGELYGANLSSGEVMRLTPASAPAPTGSLTARYRLSNPDSLDHLYTTDANEYAVLPSCCGWQVEGAPYNVFSGPGSAGGVVAVPNYRLYNPASRQHHWTTDANEYNVLPAFGWTQEGVDGYILPGQASGAVPLYRLYLHAFGGLHLWTTDSHERYVLTTSAGWIDEGIAGYVLPLP
jgi:glucose/arabinose dehydrogenase